MKKSVSPRVISALHEVINIKGYMMQLAFSAVPHITLQEALPRFHWYVRNSYIFHCGTLAMAREQATILQEIIKGVPSFYMKQCQTNGYYPITKWVWNGKQYVCHRQKCHYENHERVITWQKGGEYVETQEDYDEHIAMIERRLNSYSYLASLSPMTDTHNYNMK